MSLKAFDSALRLSSCPRLLVGVLINLTLQVALLLVVSMNMLENPFPDTKAPRICA